MLKHLTTSGVGQENPTEEVHPPKLGYKCARSVWTAETMGLLHAPPRGHQAFPVAICFTTNSPDDEVSVTGRQEADVPGQHRPVCTGGMEWPLYQGKLAVRSCPWFGTSQHFVVSLPFHSSHSVIGPNPMAAILMWHPLPFLQIRPPYQQAVQGFSGVGGVEI